MNNKEDSRNLVLALVLSGIVLFGWTYFYAMPQMQADTERAQQQAAQQQAAQQQAAQPGAAAGGAGASADPGALPGLAPLAASREAALALTPRIPIETPRLRGSIALTGGRIDDLTLLNYFERPQRQGPNIVLFSPEAAQDAYFADFGWLAQGLDVPRPQTVWTAEAGAKLTPTTPVTLRFDNGQGLVFTRTISVDDTYMFTVKDTVSNAMFGPVLLTPFGFVARLGAPVTMNNWILHEGMIGVGNDELQTATYHDQDEAGRTSFEPSVGGWTGMTDKYWAAAVIPDQSRPFTASFMSEDGPRRVYRAAITTEPVTVAPGATVEYTKNLFAGAKEVRLIDGYEASLGIEKFELMIDWGWFYFLTKPLFWLMDWFFHLVGNFGVAILLVTLVIKAIFFPLANTSYASMAKMKAVQPQMKVLQDRYKDDKVALQKEMMELYKKEKINPVTGCLPVLIQIPVFFALYKVLFVTIEMRHAPFFGWVQDLSAPDPTSIFNLFGLLPFAVPAFLLIGVWPIFMGITMWLQMKMNPEPTDPVQKAIFGWMPLIFTFMLATFPAGLVIYWTWNNLLSILQQYFIMKRYNVKIELWDNLRGMFKKAEKPAA
jgi:YidC/Oxa1 family membrane protein insertase